MMFDDVANSSHNPFRGKLFNFPWKSLEEAVDVYAGCKIDYRGADLNPNTFLAVLEGNATGAGGRVLRSDSDDHVFLNFVDHGDVGLICFPGEDDDDVLHAKDLLAALERAHKKGMYKQLAIYLETCNSGSMFADLLPEDSPVYAVTAANAQESSFGTYCYEQGLIAGKEMDTCLGDLFSVNWMEDSERPLEQTSEETLAAQFERVKELTNESHVMRYGSVDVFGRELVSDFQGPGDERFASPRRRPTKALRSRTSVDSRDIKLEHLRRRYARTGDAWVLAEMHRELAARADAERLADAIMSKASLGRPLAAAPAKFRWTPSLFDCHHRAVSAFTSSCGWRESRLGTGAMLYRLCAGAEGDAAPIVEAIRGACPASKPEAVWV